MTRNLTSGRHFFDDLSPGDVVETGRVRITAELIDSFAEMTGDRFEIHMEDAAAQRHGFPGRIAHGLLILSLVDGLKNQADAQFAAIASLAWDWKFSRPVFIDDLLGARITVSDMRETRKPDRGILTLDFDVSNQHNETVQNGVNQLMVYRRAGN